MPEGQEYKYNQPSFNSKPGAARNANQGSKTVTHKTMTIKSNTKGVPEVSTKYGAAPTVGKGIQTAGHMPHPKK